MRSGLFFVMIILCSGLVASHANAGDGQVAEELKVARQMLDDAFSNNDVATIRSMVTPDHVGVTSYYRGSFTAEEEIATLSEFKGRYFDFSDTKVDVLGDNAAMITF